MSILPYVAKYAHHEHSEYLQRSGEGVKSPGTGITGSGELQRKY